MDLEKAFEMQLDYHGNTNPIRVDKDGYICLTDLVKFYPKKRIGDWEKLASTKEFIEAFRKNLNSDDSRSLKLVKKRRGRYDGGTYAHELIAFEFATWLSAEFKLKVFFEYTNGLQNKENWKIKRILAAYNYKLMTDAVKDAHEDPKFYHYTNEAKMINNIVFGFHQNGIRDNASEEELNRIAAMESHNATLIEIGMDYHERKDVLANIYRSNYIKKIGE